MENLKRDARRAAAMRQSPQQLAPHNANMGTGGLRQVGVQAVYQVAHDPHHLLQPNPEYMVAAVTSTEVVPYEPAARAANICSAPDCISCGHPKKERYWATYVSPKIECQDEIPTQHPALPCSPPQPRTPHQSPPQHSRPQHSPAHPCTPERMPSVAMVHTWVRAPEFPLEPTKSREPASRLLGGLAGRQAPPITRSRTLAELRVEMQKLEEQNAVLKKGYTVLNCCWRRVLQIHLKEAKEKLPELEKKISAAL